MYVSLAHRLARQLHSGQLTRTGEPLIDHVERVARAVPPRSRAVAYLHDTLERQSRAIDELILSGLSDREFRVLALLTRRRSEPYERYVMRIAGAKGTAGRIARTIKLADLDDHLRHRPAPDGAPDYAWARKQIVSAQRANGERH